MHFFFFWSGAGASNEAIIRSEIEDIINGISDAGNIYSLSPFDDTWDVFLDFFKATISGVGMIRCWIISCEMIETEKMVMTGVRNTGNRARYIYKIRGYQSFNYNTSTEKAFLLIALAILAALNSGIVNLANVYDAELAQLNYQPGTFGNVLAHQAEITQVVWGKT